LYAKILLLFLKDMDQNKNAVDIFNLRALGYQEKFMDVAAYHDTFDLFCSCMPAKANLLDIACGPGNISRYLLEKRPDFHILGIDLAHNMIDLARANNPAAEYRAMDCREIGSIGQKYNGIMCGFCLPYLSEEDATKLITDVKKILLPDGVFYISTMEENEWNRSGMRKSSYGDEMYQYYHTAANLQAALEQNGYTIFNLQRIEMPAVDGSIATDLIIIGRREPS
jgi:2-polyprenyl-3-methyl-5-hydroxy-6-metoxy-1,4-benzoquinol methylase